jgi:hypothetical protein
VFQQFSEFIARLLPGGGDDASHLLEEDEVGESAQVLKTLALELGEPAQGLGQTEEAVPGLLLAAVAAGAVISAALCTFAIECRADYAMIWPGQIPRV